MAAILRGKGASGGEPGRIQDSSQGEIFPLRFTWLKEWGSVRARVRVRVRVTCSGSGSDSHLVTMWGPWRRIIWDWDKRSHAARVMVPGCSLLRLRKIGRKCTRTCATLCWLALCVKVPLKMLFTGNVNIRWERNDRRTSEGSVACHTITRTYALSLLFGPRFLPGPTTTFTKRRLYLMRFIARPFGCFFLSCFATLGV